MTPYKVENQREATVGKLLQLLIILSATFTSFYVFVSLIGNYLSFKIWDTSIVNFDFDEVLTANELASYRFTQLFYQIGVFLAPALFFALLLRQNPVHYFKLNKLPSLSKLPVVLLLLVLAIPATSYLVDALNGVNWPNGIKEAEKTTGFVMNQLLNAETTQVLLVNVLIIVIIPAFVEEIYFRGLLQRVLQGLFGNIHVAVLLTGFIFALIHGQLSSLLGFWLMGMVLGYLYHYTGNLWYSILFHLFNNGISLWLDWMYRTGRMSANPDEIAVPALLGIVCLLLLAYLLYRNVVARSRGSLKLRENLSQTTWVKLYESSDLIKVQLICDRLVAEGYDATVLNKKDSNYGLGFAEIHLPAHQYESAAAFIKTLI
ncbi:CPBP family intramembrane metalloprotease [bacterium]|nr:CPBP family intramembrane metalloprotease [bacterium]